MIGIDTNLLARLILRDDTGQFRRVEAAFSDMHTKGGRSFISVIVLCELMWLLHARYGYRPQPLADIVDMLLHSVDFTVEDEEIVSQTLELYKAGHADFPDILIGLRNRRSGCKTTLTFDKSAATLDEFTLLA